MAADPIIRFDYGICLEKIEGLPQNTRRISHDSDDKVCTGCAGLVLAKFAAALENEYHYPPSWGAVAIHLDLWSDLLGEKFLKSWANKMKEYDTPVQRRVYCQQNPDASGGEFCNNFVGDASKQGLTFVTMSTEKDGSWRRQIGRCSSCRNMACYDCRGAIHSEEILDHHCVTTSDEEKQESFPNNTRGKEWQKCSNEECAIKIGLRDGCNAMTCTFCDTQFCFLCGKQAAHDGDHWTEGKPCPRWGPVDAARPIFDQPNDEALDNFMRLFAEDFDPDRKGIIDLEFAGDMRIRVFEPSMLLDLPSIQFVRAEAKAFSDDFNAGMYPQVSGHDEFPTLATDLNALITNLLDTLDHMVLSWTINFAEDRDREFTDLDPDREFAEGFNFNARHLSFVEKYRPMETNLFKTAVFGARSEDVYARFVANFDMYFRLSREYHVLLRERADFQLQRLVRRAIWRQDADPLPRPRPED